MESQSKQAVFVAGCARSGTTLLGSMLGNHPLCLTAPEAKFTLAVYKAILRQHGEVALTDALPRIMADTSFQIWNMLLRPDEIAQLEKAESYPHLIKDLVGQYSEFVGKAAAARWIDHTPHSILDVPLLFDLFPEARLLHLVRDGRATAASVMKLDWGPNTIEAAAPWWLHRVAHGLAAEARYGPERVMRVRYEELLAEPQATLQAICAFLQIDFVPQMLQATGFRVPSYTAQQHALIGGGLQAGRAHAWQQELTPRQIEIFESVAGSLLSCLGYELKFGPAARPARGWERLQAGLQEIFRARFANRLRQTERVRRALTPSVPVRAELSARKSR